MARAFLRRLLTRSVRAPKPSTILREPRRVGHRIEELEDRTVPTTITQSNGTDFVLDASSASPTMSFSFPAGSLVTEVTATIQFQKTDDNGVSVPFNDEIQYELVSPSGTSARLIAYNMWDGGPGTGNGPLVTMTFDMDAGTYVGDTSGPANGTFRPFDGFGTFFGTAASGTWTMIVSDDTGQDPLNHYDVSVTVTADRPPVASTGGVTGTRTDGQVNSLSWSASDPDGNLSSVSAVLYLNGSFLTSSGATAGTFNIDGLAGLGTYLIQVSASDSSGLSDFASQSFTLIDDDTTGPSISLGGSTGSETDAATQNFTWSASDPSGILTSSITVTRNGSTIHTNNVSSGSFNFDSFGPGTYVLSTSFSDSDLDRGFVDPAGSSANRTVTVTDDDATAPSIVLGGSNGSETDAATQNFTWNVSDASGIGSNTVTITRNGSTIFTSSNLVDSFNFDSFGLGTYQILVNATDSDTDWVGDSLSNSNSQTVVVTDDDTTAPAVVLGGSSGTEFSVATQNFTWSATDASGIASTSVTVRKNGTPIFTSSAASGSYNFDAQDLGTFVIEVQSTDADTDWSGDQTTSAVFTRTATVVADTSIILTGSSLVITDEADPKDDNLTIRLDGSTSEIVVSDPVNFLSSNTGTGSNSHEVRIPLASVTSIQVNTLGGLDTLTVNYSGGDLPPVGFDGGNPTAGAGDKLVLTGGIFLTVTHTLISADSGTVTAGANTVSYTGLEPVLDNMGAVNRIFDFTGAAETITLSDTGGADAMMTIDSTLSESINFANPSGSLTILTTAAAGADVVTISSLDVGFGGSLAVDAKSTDTANLDATADIGNGFLSITAGVINSNAPIATTGPASLSATNGSIVDGNGAALNLTAGLTVLTATGGVGTAADPLETMLTNLEGSAGNGFHVANGGDLIIGGAGPISGVSVTGGNIAISAAGSIAVDEPVDNTGGGTVGLVASGLSQTIVTNGSWSKSTIVNPGDPSPPDWVPSNPPPGLGTFTDSPILGGNPPFVDGTDAADIGGGALAFRAGPGVEWYRTTFALPVATGITANVRFSVDNNAQVFINGQEVAREVTFSTDNFAPPGLAYPAFRINPDGSISNIVQVDQTFAFTGWAVGTNELIVAVRNVQSVGETGGLVFRMDLTTAGGDITVAAAVSASGGGAVNLSAAGSITESGSGLANTSGTLTTSSATGQTLNGANTVGTFNATNSTSGNVSFTNTAATLTISGISETGGTVAVNNTGSTTISGTGITSTGGIQVDTTEDLTVSSDVSSSGGSSALSFGSSGAANNALLNAAITGSSASVTGGSGANAITVNTSGTTTLTLDGAGAGDTFNVNYGTLGGTVAIADTGVAGTDAAFLTGTGAADTFEVNTSAAGAANTIRLGAVQKTTYTASLEAMTIDAADGGDTVNVQFANSLLPGSFTIADTGAGGADTANLYGTSAANVFNINTAAADAVQFGSPATEVVNYTGNLEQLTISGPGYPGDPAPVEPTAADGGDTFIATPDAQTLITIHGGNPVITTPGDTLQLTAIGLLNPAVTPNPGRPDGQLASSNRQTLNWTSIESLPVPIGLGGSFDFGSPTSNVQGGFIGITPSDTPSSGQFPANPGLSFPGVGWVNAGAGAFDRFASFGASGNPNSAQLVNLLRDGEWGYAGGGANNGVFQVAVAPNQNVAVTAFIGDTYAPRDRTNVYVSDSANPTTYTKLNPTIDTFATTGGAHQYVSYTGMFRPTTNTLLITVEHELGGTSSFWTITGLDVRPQQLIAPLFVSGPLATALEADGQSVDTYTGTGAVPNAELTIAPQYGTPVSVATTGTTGWVGTGTPPAASGTDLIAGRLPLTNTNSQGGQEGSSGVDVLTDGLNPAVIAPAPPATSVYTIGSNASLTYALNTAAYPYGFDLTGINVIARWRDASRSQIDIASISYSTVAAPGTFLPIAGTAATYLNGVYDAVQYTASGGVMAAGVAAVRFNFGTQANGFVGYGELDVFGTPSDADPSVKGFQVVADSTGAFTFKVQRPTGTGPSLITVTDVTGESGAGNLGQTGAGLVAATPNPFALPEQPLQAFALPAVRRLDVGPAAGPAAAGYLGQGNGAYASTAANALGWVGAAPALFDAGLGFNALQRDGAFANGTGDFRFDVAPSTTYAVTVLLGHPTNAQAGMSVQVVTGTTTATLPANVSTPAGQSTSATFLVTSDATGAIVLRFSNATTNANAFWTLQALEYRPPAGSATPGAQLGVALDGGTNYAGATLPLAPVNAGNADTPVTTVYNVTGATPNAVLTITTTLGTFVTTDQSPLYTGLQVVADGGGNASFSITSPISTTNLTGTIAVTEVTGASIGVFSQPYTGVAPPASPPPATAQRFDFNSASPTVGIPGFVGVEPGALYSTTAGYGWKTSVSGYDRGSAPSAPGTSDLFRDGAWGYGSGVFQVGVTAGASRDVRLYYGDPYAAWSGITLQVEGGTPVSVDAAIDRYGFVTATGTDVTGPDSVPDGVLDITILGGIWVASGLDVAVADPARVNLPEPATGTATTAASRRLEFAASPITDFTSALAGYDATAGFGWTTPVNSFVRPASMFPTDYTGNTDFYGSGAWSMGASTFAIAVPLGAPGATYSVKAYLSDPYASWNGITVSGENVAGSTVSSSISPPTEVVLSGLQDLNGDGVITVTVSGSVWVMNGLDFVTDPDNFPAAP